MHCGALPLHLLQKASPKTSANAQLRRQLGVLVPEQRHLKPKRCHTMFRGLWPHVSPHHGNGHNEPEHAACIRRPNTQSTRCAKGMRRSFGVVQVDEAVSAPARQTPAPRTRRQARTTRSLQFLEPFRTPFSTSQPLSAPYYSTARTCALLYEPCQATPLNRPPLSLRDGKPLPF